MNRAGWYALAASVLCYLLFVQVYAAWDYTIDDAFITLTYSKNLLEYGQIIWHPSMPAVEGYSNFSYVLLGALALKMGLSPMIVLKFMGLLMLIISALLVYCLTRLWLAPHFAVIPVFWLLFYKGQILWAISGLETSTYQALCVMTTYCLLRGLGYQFVPASLDEPDRAEINLNYFFLAGLCLSMAGLTRPEAPALMLLFGLIGLCYWLGSTEKRRVGQAMSVTFLTLLVFYMPYYLWRWSHFGQLFPNSVYCKWLTSVSNGELDWEYLQLILPLLLISLPYLIKRGKKQHCFLLLPSVLYLLLLYNSDSVVGFFNRHFLMAFALFIPLPAMGLVYLSQLLYLPSDIKRPLVGIVAVLIGLLFIPHFSLTSYETFSYSTVVGNQARERLALWLDRHLNKNDVVVMGDCGVTPYLTHFPIIDSYCLNNPYMTRRPINNSYPKFVKWVLNDVKPKVIILMEAHDNTRTIKAPAAKYFLSNPKFLNNYHLTKTLDTRSGNRFYRYEIYKKTLEGGL